MNREEMLMRIQQTTNWDIIIIGGGATGLGCAVDAASRGYQTLLVEQYDFGKGTSGRSTKLVHGGVRYLAQGNLKLVMEAARERAYLLRNAPQVASVAPFVVPVYNRLDKWFYGTGLKIYDLLAGSLSLGKTRWLSKAQTLRHLQGINQKKLTGGILYYDGQFDDTRLAIELAGTAVAQGAVALNYVKAEAITKTDNRITGIMLRDELTGKTHMASSKIVINATGVFADAVRQMDKASDDELIAPSQGAHIVVDASFFPGNAAMMIPKTDDGRVLFAVPWHNKVIIGTTDTPVTNASIDPKPLPEEVDFIIQHVNRYLSYTITKENVLSMFAGLRPLIKQKGVSATAMLSRDHTILLSDSGLLTVSGGKWTTYRKIAEDVISRAAMEAKLPPKKCITRTLPIGRKDRFIEKQNNFLQSDSRCSEEDIAFFVTEEMAMTVEDILARRTRLLFLDVFAARNAAPSVARQMAVLLYKGEDWIQNQLLAFNELTKQYIPE